jgi:hypothetical protein
MPKGKPAIAVPKKKVNCQAGIVETAGYPELSEETLG